MGLYSDNHSSPIVASVIMQSLWRVKSEQRNALTNNLMAQSAMLETITAELRQTMNSLCKQHGITREHFINPTTDVGDEPTYSITGIYYTSNLVYSTPEGDLTASTLVTLLQQWLRETEENVMQVTVGESHLVIYKLCGLINNSPTSKEVALLLCPLDYRQC